MTTINLADERLTGPSTFAAAGPTEPIILTVAGVGVTITGGVILGSATDEVAEDPVIYGTASTFDDVQPDPSLQQSLTISLSNATTDFAVEIFNGLPTEATYQITDNEGDSTTITLPANSSLDSAATVNIANTHGATVFTITPLGGAPWDFFIDNISFDYSAIEAKIPGDISTMHLSALPDIVITMSELAILLAPSAASTLFFTLQVGVLYAWAMSLDTQKDSLALNPQSSATASLAASAVPFDPDYKQQYTPTFFQFSTIQPDSTITAQTAADANTALSDLSKQIGYMQALEITMNRLSSAIQENDQTSITLQASELDSFLTLSSASLAAVAKDLNTLGNDFAGVSLPTLTTQQISSFISNVQANGLSGLPQQEQTLLSSLGVASSDIQNMVSAISSDNPSIVPLSLATSLQQVSTSFQSFANTYAGTSGTLSASSINNVYEAVLQRPASQVEINNWLSVDSSSGDASVISQIVGLPEAQFNVYPIIQIIQLATGNLPTAAQLAGWVPFIEQNGLLTGQAQTNSLLDQMAEAFVASDNFAKVYNPPFTGTDVNPNSPVTAGEMQIIIKAATGIAATQTQVNVWVGLGLTIDQVFVDFALGDQYTAFSQAGNQQYLTTVADTAAGIQAAAAIVGTANASLVAHAA